MFCMRHNGKDVVTQLDLGFTPCTLGRLLLSGLIQDALKLQGPGDPASVSQGTESTGLDTVPGGGLRTRFCESCAV